MFIEGVSLEGERFGNRVNKFTSNIWFLGSKTLTIFVFKRSELLRSFLPFVYPKHDYL